MSKKAPLKRVRILGVPVTEIDMARALQTIEHWIEAGESRYVCACDVHSLMRAHDDPAHMDALENADLVTPDGQPLVWTARLRGAGTISRVAGPDLMPLLCAHSLAKGWGHFFYGGAEGVAEELARRLEARFPGLRVAGTASPPFRPLSDEERAADIARIVESGAQIVWVGLGCPKQEAWMRDNVDRIPGAVLLGVGAAFDLHAGRIRRAPRWLRENGLEWLHRLLSEPRRLWYRYLWLAPRFALASLAETLTLGRRRRA